MARTKHDYPARIIEAITTLQEALSDHHHDRNGFEVEEYYDFLPDNIDVSRRPLIGDSHLIDGFVVHAIDGEKDVLWRVVWAPFYPDNFTIQLVTGTETRKVWQWKKLRRVDAEFYTFETLHRYDHFNGWDAIEDTIFGALDCYREWKAGRLVQSGVVAEVTRA